MFRYMPILPTRQGLYYAVLAAFVVAGAFLRNINLLYVISGAMVALLLINLAAVLPALRRIELRRRAPRGVEAGRRFIVRLSVITPPRRRGCEAAVLEDSLYRVRGGPRRRPIRPRCFVSGLTPGSTVGAEYEGILPDRGLYRFGSVFVSTQSPLGLLARMIHIRLPAEMIVYPRLGTLQSERLAAVHPRLETLGPSRRRPTVVEGEFYGLRDWRNEDGRCRIHWRTTARRNALTAVQFEQPLRHRWMILLDPWLSNPSTRTDRRRVETAVSLAATLIDHRCRATADQRGEILVGLAGRRVDFFAGESFSGFAEAMLRQLALLEPDRTGRRGGELLGEAAARRHPETTVFWITSRPAASAADDPLTAELAAWAGRIGRERLVVFHADAPDLADFFTLPPDEVMVREA